MYAVIPVCNLNMYCMGLRRMYTLQVHITCTKGWMAHLGRACTNICPGCPLMTACTIHMASRDWLCSKPQSRKTQSDPGRAHLPSLICCSEVSRFGCRGRPAALASLHHTARLSAEPMQQKLMHECAAAAAAILYMYTYLYLYAYLYGIHICNDVGNEMLHGRIVQQIDGLDDRAHQFDGCWG